MRTFDRVLIALAGTAMVSAFVAINVLSPWLGTPTFMLLVGVACAGYLIALVTIRKQRPAGGFLVVCLLFAAAIRLPLLVTGPGTDVYRYAWDARVRRAGFNPYVVVPSDPAFSYLHDDETRRINHPDLPTPYPPGAQLFFRIVSRVSDRAYDFKPALALCDALLVALLWRWLRLSGLEAGWIIVYAWNPLVILTTEGEGHLDVFGVVWLVASILLLARGRRLFSSLCFALSVAIKPLPLVLAPLYWGRIRPRDAIAAMVLFGALYAPYLSGTRLPIGSLGVFIERFRFNETLFATTSPLVGARGAAALAMIAGAAVGVVMRRRAPVTSTAAWAWPMAMALALSPVVYPWYLVWLVPFAIETSARPLLVWSLSVLPTYIVWHLDTLGRPWTVPAAVLIVEFGAVIGTALLVWPRRNIVGTSHVPASIAREE